MKQLTILLFVLLSFTISKAQDGKPTKEETIKYIINYFSGFENTPFSFGVDEQEFKGVFEGKRRESSKKMTFYMKYSDFVFSNCQMQFSQSSFTESTKSGYGEGIDEYKKITPHTYGLKKNVINFNKVEAIRIAYKKPVIVNSKGEDVPSDFRYLSFYFFSLKENGKYDSYELELGELENNIEGESLKIYKAFQHLRKLCGAPEPISFD